MYFPGCRECFSKQSINSKLLFDEESKEYRCERNQNHRYTPDNDGMLMALK
jgi:hypothetical protein